MKKAIEYLKANYTHSNRTNVGEGRISNHDAMAILVAVAGDFTPVKELIDALNAWRGAVKSTVCSPIKGYCNPNGKLTNTYLFNDSVTGGYGFVGKNINSISREVCGFSMKGGEFTTKRRTYWFRASHGKYSPTLECYKRLGELGLTVAVSQLKK